MFGLFSTTDTQHPQLGTLKLQKGHWRGTMALPGKGAVPLILAGSRKGPDTAAVGEALLLPARFAQWQPMIATALYEHFDPYAESYAAQGEDASTGAVAPIRNAQDAWAQATLAAIVIAPLSGAMATELCFTTRWDEEHTLGARFQGERWLELCGSALIP